MILFQCRFFLSFGKMHFSTKMSFSPLDSGNFSPRKILGDALRRLQRVVFEQKCNQNVFTISKTCCFKALITNVWWKLFVYFAHIKLLVNRKVQILFKLFSTCWDLKNNMYFSSIEFNVNRLSVFIKLLFISNHINCTRERKQEWAISLNQFHLQ